MRAWIYATVVKNERASMLLRSTHSDFHEYFLGEHFTDKQFRAEFGDEAEYPQIAIGVHHRGSLKETLNYKERGMFVE